MKQNCPKCIVHTYNYVGQLTYVRVSQVSVHFVLTMQHCKKPMQHNDSTNSRATKECLGKYPAHYMIYNCVA